MRREPTEVIVLFLSSIEQSGGKSKKVISFNLTGKCEPLVFELKMGWVSKQYVLLLKFGKWFPGGGGFLFCSGGGLRVWIGCKVRRGKSRQDLYKGIADLRKGICGSFERKRLSRHR
jgi:hypothetical protein